MVDIAASLSLTSTGPALDVGAVIGLETADTQAFGDILAGKVGGGDTAAPAAGAPANPFAAVTLSAGTRQPGGNILPDAAAVLPDPAAADPELPAAPVAVAAPVSPLLAAKLAAALARSSDTPAGPDGEAATPGHAKQAEASPVHGLIKLLTAAFKTQRSTTIGEAEEAPAGQEAPASETTGDSGEPAALSADAIIQVQAALSLPGAAAETPATALHGKANSQAGHAAPRAVEQAAVQSAVHAVSLAATPQPAPQDAAPATPVLTVAAEAPAAAVTLLTQPVLPAGRAISARVKLASADAPQAGGTPAAATQPAAAAIPAAQVAPTAKGEARSADVPAAAPRGLIAERMPLAERASAEFVASPVLPGLVDGSAQAPAPAAPGAVPAAGAAPAGQDFAALVERLVDARNSGAAQSTHATVQHAEFGQVSLKFQQDGGGLNVSMASADPDFAIAAAAAMPADRQAFNSSADAQPRQNQGQQNQAQAGFSSNSQHEASAQRDAAGSDQHGRGNRGGRNSNADDTSNPPPRWGDRDQPQSRGGVFA